MNILQPVLEELFNRLFRTCRGQHSFLLFIERNFNFFLHLFACLAVEVLAFAIFKGNNCLPNSHLYVGG